MHSTSYYPSWIEILCENLCRKLTSIHEMQLHWTPNSIWEYLLGWKLFWKEMKHHFASSVWHVSCTSFYNLSLTSVELCVSCTQYHETLELQTPNIIVHPSSIFLNCIDAHFSNHPVISMWNTHLWWFPSCFHWNMLYAIIQNGEGKVKISNHPLSRLSD